MKAYISHHEDFPDVCGVVWADTRGSARWRAAKSLMEAFCYSGSDAFCGMRLQRAPEFDGHSKASKLRTYSLEYMAKINERTREGGG